MREVLGAAAILEEFVDLVANRGKFSKRNWEVAALLLENSNGRISATRFAEMFRGRHDWFTAHGPFGHLLIEQKRREQDLALLQHRIKELEGRFPSFLRKSRAQMTLSPS
jgi:hypothetical protein